MPEPAHNEKVDETNVIYIFSMIKYGLILFAFFIPLIIEILYPANEKLIGVNASFSSLNYRKEIYLFFR